MSRSYKKREDYAEFILRARGPSDTPALTVEIQSSFSEAFKDELKREVPYDSRSWDSESSVWRVHPDFSLNAQDVAKKHYRSVTLVNGAEVTNLHTGKSYRVGNLFDSD